MAFWAPTASLTDLPRNWPGQDDKRGAIPQTHKRQQGHPGRHTGQRIQTTCGKRSQISGTHGSPCGQGLRAVPARESHRPGHPGSLQSGDDLCLSHRAEPAPDYGGRRRPGAAPAAGSAVTGPDHHVSRNGRGRLHAAHEPDSRKPSLGNSRMRNAGMREKAKR